MLKIDKNLAGSLHDKIVAWIKEWFADKEGPVIVGVSGGKDSTICAALLVEALGSERVVGVLMPNGEQKDISDSHRVCEYLKIKNYTINIANVYTDMTNNVRPFAQSSQEFPPPLYSTNTPARLRMVTLYSIAALLKGFVVNTCNASENFVSWATKFGDAAGDFSLFDKLTVSEVLAIGDYMKLPYELVHKTPDDGMCGLSDEQKMGFSYDQLDAVILGRENEVEISDEIKEKIKSMHKNPNAMYKCIQMPNPFPKKLDMFGRKDF